MSPCHLWQCPQVQALNSSIFSSLKNNDKIFLLGSVESQSTNLYNIACQTESINYKSINKFDLYHRWSNLDPPSQVWLGSCTLHLTSSQNTSISNIFHTITSNDKILLTTNINNRLSYGHVWHSKQFFQQIINPWKFSKCDLWSCTIAGSWYDPCSYIKYFWAHLTFSQFLCKSKILKCTNLSIGYINHQIIQASKPLIRSIETSHFTSS